MSTPLAAIQLRNLAEQFEILDRENKGLIEKLAQRRDFTLTAVYYGNTWCVQDVDRHIYSCQSEDAAQALARWSREGASSPEPHCRKLHPAGTDCDCGDDTPKPPAPDLAALEEDVYLGLAKTLYCSDALKLKNAIKSLILACVEAKERA